MDIFICSNSFHFASIVSTSTRLSNVTHITSACVSSRWRHCVASITGLWIQNALRHRLCALDETCPFIFSLSCLPLPHCCYIMLCSHKRWFCVFAEWMESFLGLEFYHRNAWKWLSRVPWNDPIVNLSWISDFELILFFFKEVKLLFLPPFPWHGVSILPEPSPQLTHY